MNEEEKQREIERLRQWMKARMGAIAAIPAPPENIKRAGSYAEDDPVAHKQFGQPDQV